MNKTDTQRLPSTMQTVMVFAARYTHHRGTGGTLAVTKALLHSWQQLDKQTQDQIIRESEEATENKDDWQKFKEKITKQHEAN